MSTDRVLLPIATRYRLYNHCYVMNTGKMYKDRVSVVLLVKKRKNVHGTYSSFVPWKFKDMIFGILVGLFWKMIFLWNNEFQKISDYHSLFWSEYTSRRPQHWHLVDMAVALMSSKFDKNVDMMWEMNCPRLDSDWKTWKMRNFSSQCKVEEFLNFARQSDKS